MKFREIKANRNSFFTNYFLRLYKIKNNIQLNH